MTASRLSLKDRLQLHNYWSEWTKNMVPVRDVTDWAVDGAYMIKFEIETYRHYAR